MRHRLSKSLIGLTLAAVALTACGGGGDGTTTTSPSGGAMTVTVTATEFAFSPDELQVPAGAEVTLTLVNQGVVEHDITIDELDFHLLAQPGETVSATVTVPSGIYHVYCAVPGHHEAGMMGTLIASG